MQVKSSQLGPLETQAFAWVQLKKRQLVRSGEIASVLGLTLKRETELFGRLCRSQLILRLMKGLYLFPLQIPPGGKWGPNPDWVLAQFMAALAVPYQVTGLWAFHRYGFSEQVPSRMAVYNTKLSGEKIIGNTGYDFIKVDSKRLGSTDVKVTTDNIAVVFSSSARTLFDACYDWDRFGTIPKVFGWIGMRVDDKKLMTDLINATALYGNIGTTRRVGYILSHLGVSKDRVKKLQEIATDTTSFIPLNPSQPKRGPIDKTWGLIINDTVGGGNL